MNIHELATQAGLHIATDVNWMPIISLEYAEKFAALVVANIDPKSFMSWQEGYAAGVAQEREECAELMFRLDLYGEEGKAAEAIRARGNT
jgi:hypothetical protein